MAISTLLYFIITFVLGVGAFFAYEQGYADPLIEKIGYVLHSYAFERRLRGIAMKRKRLECKKSELTRDRVCFFKVKAKAEQKALEAKGEKAGEDFLKSMAPTPWHIHTCVYFQQTANRRGQLNGSEQAGDVQDGIGAIGGLKKNL